MRVTYIGVELTNEAREVVMLEVFGKQILGEIRVLPNNKRVSTFAPRYHVVRACIIHQLIRLRQKRRRHRSLRHFAGNLD